MPDSSVLFEGKQPLAYTLFDKRGAARLPVTWAIVGGFVPLYFLLVLDSPEYPLVWVATSLAGYAAMVLPWVVWRRLLTRSREILELFRIQGDRPSLPRLLTEWRLFAFATVTAAAILWSINAISGASTSLAQGLVFLSVAVSMATAIPLLALSIAQFFRLATCRAEELKISSFDPLATPGIRALVDICRLEASLGAILFFFVLAPFTLVLHYDAANAREPVIWWSIALPTLAAVVIVGVFGPRWITSAPREVHVLQLYALRERLAALDDEVRRMSVFDPSATSVEGRILATKTVIESVLQSGKSEPKWVDVGSLVVSAAPLVAQIVLVATRTP